MELRRGLVDRNIHIPLGSHGAYSLTTLLILCAITQTHKVLGWGPTRRYPMWAGGILRYHEEDLGGMWRERRFEGLPFEDATFLLYSFSRYGFIEFMRNSSTSGESRRVNPQYQSVNGNCYPPYSHSRWNYQFIIYHLIRAVKQRVFEREFGLWNHPSLWHVFLHNIHRCGGWD